MQPTSNHRKPEYPVVHHFIGMHKMGVRRSFLRNDADVSRVKDVVKPSLGHPSLKLNHVLQFVTGNSLYQLPGSRSAASYDYSQTGYLVAQDASGTNNRILAVAVCDSAMADDDETGFALDRHGRPFRQENTWIRAVEDYSDPVCRSAALYIPFLELLRHRYGVISKPDGPLFDVRQEARYTLPAEDRRGQLRSGSCMYAMTRQPSSFGTGRRIRENLAASSPARPHTACECAGLRHFLLRTERKGHSWRLCRAYRCGASLACG